MIGLGTQDTMDEAYDFVERFDLTFTMLWDETFESWAHFQVSGQPAAILFAPDGTGLAGWMGAFPEEEVLRLIGA